MLVCCRRERALSVDTRNEERGLDFLQFIGDSTLSRLLSELIMLLYLHVPRVAKAVLSTSLWSLIVMVVIVVCGCLRASSLLVPTLIADMEC